MFKTDDRYTIEVMEDIDKARAALKAEFETLTDKRAIIRSTTIKALFDVLREIPKEDRSDYGSQLNKLKEELQGWIAGADEQQSTAQVDAIDVTAPWATNSSADQRPIFLPAMQGSVHPLRVEIAKICDIYQRMGFMVEESREIDNDFNMFTSLNFAKDHPSRDDYDTFMTDEGLIAPAHTSTMQNRILKSYKSSLEQGEPIAVVVPDRVFRNEDLDATHEHTFYQVEGVYVSKGVTVSNLIATLSAFMNEYFGQELKTKLQPFYFPFTEPSFEFAIERPDALKKDNSEEQKWLEMLGCGMIHPNVLAEAGIDSAVYSGFAWGGGIERLVMMKHGIEDIRHFQSGNLAFLRQFS